MDESTKSNLDAVLSNVSVRISFFEGIFILVFALILGFVLRYIFQKFSTTYSSRVSFGNTILIVTFSVAALIAVVKSSLALSLGLVGALSVIRFRTAVKEPYNLAFLLLSICAGISIGASQVIFSLLICFFGSIAVIYIYKKSSIKNNNSKDIGNEDFDTIALTIPSSVSLDSIYKILENNTQFFSITSFDQTDSENMEIIIKVKIGKSTSLINIKDIIFSEFPGSRFSFYNSPDT